MEDRFKRISDLEDAISVELKEIDEIDFTQKDEKLQKQSFYIYQTCQSLGENSRIENESNLW